MSKSSTSKPVFKKFCKVCQDAGKPESEYTSHNVRESKDPKSKTLCPTLLTQECRHCFRKGHTVKYCLILKKQQSLPTYNVGVTETKSKKREVTNVFMLLESDSEEEAEEEENLPTPSSTRVALDYANIIRITHKQERELQAQVQVQVQVQIEAKQIPKPIPQIPRVFGKSRWLDVVSSSDEEDNSDEE